MHFNEIAVQNKTIRKYAVAFKLPWINAFASGETDNIESTMLTPNIFRLTCESINIEDIYFTFKLKHTSAPVIIFTQTELIATQWMRSA